MLRVEANILYVALLQMTERLKLSKDSNGNQVDIGRIDALGSDRDNRHAPSKRAVTSL